MLVALLLLGVAAPKAEDAFIAGYATAVLERDFGLRPIAVEVEDGVLVVRVEDLGGIPEERVVAALTGIRGVQRVEIQQGAVAAVEGVPSDGEEPEGEEPGGEEPGGEERRKIEILPRWELFEPLIADVRWPHFSASFQWYLDDGDLGHVGSTSFAETFALLAGDFGRTSRWEFGLQAGVFSIFDLDSRSQDLLNADYMVGPNLATKWGRWTTLLRLFHQSSHLGDEFLLRNSTERVNVSFEAIDGLVSVDVTEALRLYGGGGAIVRTSPHLDPFSAQAGAEFESPWSFRGVIRPVAGIDLDMAEENDWSLDLSFRGGLQFENPKLSKLRLLLLFEYFEGHSPNGQFFEQQIEYLGVGLHLYH